MAKEDTVLPLEMQKLEIEPIKFSISISKKNPFQQKRNLIKKTHLCTLSKICSTTKVNNKTCKFSKKRQKVLKEPILKFLTNNPELSFKQRNIQYVQEGTLEGYNLCALVDNCNQLKISSDENEIKKTTHINKECTWWKKESVQEIQSKVTDNGRSGPSCSQQALNPPCDVTIDELASYFETLVHIPKKMSSMAEMMYI